MNPPRSITRRLPGLSCHWFFPQISECPSAALFKGQKPVDGEACPSFLQAVRPSYFQTINYCGVPKPKVDAQIILGNVAASASHLLVLTFAMGQTANA